MTRSPSFKVTPFFDAVYLRNRTTYRHSFNEMLIATYTRHTQQCHFEWPWVILQYNIKTYKAPYVTKKLFVGEKVIRSVLSDLAKYSMTWSVARSLRQLSFLLHPTYDESDPRQNFAANVLSIKLEWWGYYWRYVYECDGRTNGLICRRTVLAWNASCGKERKHGTSLRWC